MHYLVGKGVVRRRVAARLARRIGIAISCAAMTLAVTPFTAQAQGQPGSIAGRVTDSAGAGLAASVRVIGDSRHSVYAGADGHYVIPDIPPGSYRLETHFIGYQADTFSVDVPPGQTATYRVVLHAANNTLKSVVISSPRLNETQAGALQEQKDADNIVTVMSGDVIRSLPNANAAEALARMPGVTAERDEGEGKFVEIRGTPPIFQHVTIDGAYVPGTLNGDRSVKLDDVPADILGALEVTKTLTADQDAAAIGGSVNLVTKIPEGSPRGYASGLYAYQSLESHSNGNGAATYGGRVGNTQQLGFLLSGTFDRTNRVINDVEPSWTADVQNPDGSFSGVNGAGYTHVFPSSWSQREYNYYRTRYGLGGDLDYRFSPTSTLYIKGLWSAFFDEANRWETNLSAGGDSLIGGVPTATGATVQNVVSNRGPIEHTWGFTGGGKQGLGRLQLSYAANYAGSTANQHNHYDDSYNLTVPGFNYNYDANLTVPKYFVDGPTKGAISSPSLYNLSSLSTDNELTNGQVVGARADALIPYELGALPATFKFGVKADNEHKGYLSFQPGYAPNGNLTLAQFLSTYSAPRFYSHVCAGCYLLAPFGSIPAVNQNLVANPNDWTFQQNLVNDRLASFAGTENVLAAYGMQTLEIDNLHVNVGLRAENTTVGYVGAGVDSLGNLLPSLLRGSHSYTDLFPSLQLRYGVDDNTNLRLAVTRGIARPNYTDLAPSFNAAGASFGSLSSSISEGNPNLHPEHAWNYDLLGEHYFSSVGVISGGVFYKDITDFIFPRNFLYSGPLAAYHGFYVSQPQNGPSAHLWGTEFDYTQHLAFLPGAWRGLGFDLNWTHVESRALVPQDSGFRHAALPRQFPNLFNASILYDATQVTARMTGQYTSASIYGYGADGTSNPSSGDNYNYAHFQIDGAVTWTVRGTTALTAQVLNLNNAVFGFFNGTTAHQYNTQREYYGTTLSLGVRQGF
jgi:TonB-dependent receptor